MNRAVRRKDHKKYKKQFGFGSWDEFNQGFPKEQPILNISKKIFNTQKRGIRNDKAIKQANNFY